MPAKLHADQEIVLSVIPREIWLLIFAIVSGCKANQYDPIVGDACKISTLSERRQTLSELQSALNDCGQFPGLRQSAIACSHLDYVDATNAYALQLINKCGSPEDLLEVYEHGFEQRYDEIFDRLNQIEDED